jgi:hypothetical protein
MHPAATIAALLLSAACAAAPARAAAPTKAVVSVLCFLRADGSVANLQYKLAAAPSGNGRAAVFS